MTLLLPGETPGLWANDPHARALLVGIWPNRLRLLEESSFESVAEFRTRYGAVVWDSGGYAQTSRTPDGELYFFVTNQMETVEVVDPGRRAVVDEVTLSEPGRRVRLFGATPSPDGKRLYLTARAIGLGPDRFVPDLSADVYVYDRDERRVVDSFPLPKEVKLIGPEMRVQHVAVSPDRKLAYLGGDVVVVDLETQTVVNRREGFERGRPNTSWIVSSDGARLFVSGVGDRLRVYDTRSLALLDEVSLGGDAMFAPISLPGSVLDVEDPPP